MLTAEINTRSEIHIFPFTNHKKYNTHLAQDARIADGANAIEVVHLIDALARITTRVRGALVDIGLAFFSCKANRAFKLECIPNKHRGSH